MGNISKIRQFMESEGLNFLLVNSTNEFLVEYNTLEENSRYKLTKFSGSTGEALVTKDNIYLFVDGRYHIQADQEVNHNEVSVIKLQTGENYITKLLSLIPENETLGIFSKKNSQKKSEELSSKRKIKLLEKDPLDEIFTENLSENVSLDVSLTGKSKNEKISEIQKLMSDNEILYLTDLDEVSYLFNQRNFSRDFSAKINAKALIFKSSASLFYPEDFNYLYGILKDSDKEILVDKASVTAYDYGLLRYPKEMKNSPVKLMKSKKNEAELLHMKAAFARTDKAVSAIREYIEGNDNLSEYDISVQLEKEFKKQGALGLSFKSIIAKDKNSALAHYSKSSKDEIITDGSLVLIDCGAYFEGGLATDITRVFVKGEPSGLHKKIYTLVLKVFLNAFNYAKTHSIRPVIGFDIDRYVHEIFDNSDTEGFVFNHGLGHGIGINVHEYPPNLSTNEIAKVPIEEGMCFSIEPGLYKEGFFGVRLENSCYFKDNDIHSFVKMNYENKLINYDMLTEQEKEWLSEFEVK
jgi:Xaa-Pro aminopeptidase